MDFEHPKVMPLRAVPREPSPVAAKLIETIRAADEVSPLITGFVAWEQDKLSPGYASEPRASVITEGWMLHLSQELTARANAE